jgi:hypothetical protein
MITKDMYYLSAFITTILSMLIINNKVNIKINIYIDFLFYIALLLVSEINIKFSILLSFIYLLIKIKNGKINNQEKVKVI